jgi:hypothetical protein
MVVVVGLGLTTFLCVVVVVEVDDVVVEVVVCVTKSPALGWRKCVVDVADVVVVRCLSVVVVTVEAVIDVVVTHGGVKQTYVFQSTQHPHISHSPGLRQLQSEQQLGA